MCPQQCVLVCQYLNVDTVIDSYKDKRIIEKLLAERYLHNEILTGTFLTSLLQAC